MRLLDSAVELGIELGISRGAYEVAIQLLGNLHGWIGYSVISAYETV
jgi:hypothetical protein